jgi:outer membrane protein OmpA-like peptidoglycan-associated protein
MKKHITLFILAAGAAPLFACATTTTPTELIDARAAYRRAASGPAAEHSKAQLATAKRALDRAEEEFDDDGNEQDTRDLAYIAERLAQGAESEASLVLAQKDRSEAEKQLELAKAANQRATQEALAGANSELESERAARLEAERKEREALIALEKIGEVKESERGYVLNITGSVLFATGKSVLLKNAEDRLVALVDAIRTMPAGQKIMIEGHTDSSGSDSLNQRLSEARAEAVRSFLIRKGLERDRLDAIGFGEGNPVADNTTPEGRANNRRVEIVIEKAG